jgi:hypothetical protein
MPEIYNCLGFLCPGVKKTFSPGSSHAPGLKGSAQRLPNGYLSGLSGQGHFSPGSCYGPGLKVSIYSRGKPPDGTKDLAPVGGLPRD